MIPAIASVLLAVFLAVMIILGMWGYKVSSKTAEDYILTEKGLGYIAIGLAACMSNLSAFTAIGNPARAYLTGPVIAYVFPFATIAAIAWALVYPRLWRLTKHYGYLTPVDFFGHRYESNLLRIVVAIGLIIAALPYVALQLIGFGVLIKAVIGLSYEVGVTLGILVMLIYVLLGGMRSVAWTSVVYGIIALVALIGAVAACATVIPFSEVGQKMYTINPNLYNFYPLKHRLIAVAACLSPAYVLLFFPWVAQQAQAVKSERTCYVIAYLHPLLALFMFSMATVLGYQILAIVGKWPMPVKAVEGLIVPTLIKVSIPIGLLYFLAVSAFALSTAHAAFLFAGSVISNDIYRRVLKPDISTRALLWHTRIWLVLVALVMALPIALFRPVGLIEMHGYFSGPGLYAAAPALVMGLFWRRANKHGALWSIVLTWILIIVLGIIMPTLNPAMMLWYRAYAALLTCFVPWLLMYVISKITKPHREEFVNELLSVAQTRRQ